MSSIWMKSFEDSFLENLKSINTEKYIYYFKHKWQKALKKYYMSILFFKVIIIAMCGTAHARYTA